MIKKIVETDAKWNSLTHIYMTADIPRYDLLSIRGDINIIPLGIKILKNDI